MFLIRKEPLLRSTYKQIMTTIKTNFSKIVQQMMEKVTKNVGIFEKIAEKCHATLVKIPRK